ncbi:MAG: hypothetical protein PVF91_13925 [Chromatiales bacterium]
MVKRLLIIVALAALSRASVVAAGDLTYADLQPLLRDRCTVCHSGEAAPVGLRLDSYAALMAGSDRGRVVQPGEPAGSELVRRLTGESQPRMPLTGPPWVDAADIARVEAWVAAGAPEGAGAAAPPALPPPAERTGETFADVQPIFLQRCAKCHSDNGVLGPPPEGLRLDGWQRVVAGGARVVVVPGSPLASELWRRVEGLARPRMPHDGPPFLSDEEVALIRRWIARGAGGPRGETAPMPVGREVRLHGRLTGRWRLDGLPLDVAGARIRKAPQAGDYVEVRGRVAPQGGIRVERLRRR